jgi:hypothetical protein
MTERFEFGDRRGIVSDKPRQIFERPESLSRTIRIGVDGSDR